MQIFCLRRGEYPGFDKDKYNIYKGTYYIGYQLAHSLVGYVLVLTFWCLVGIIVVVLYYSKDVRNALKKSLLSSAILFVADYLLRRLYAPFIYFSTKSVKVVN